METKKKAKGKKKEAKDIKKGGRKRGEEREYTGECVCVCSVFR